MGGSIVDKIHVDLHNEEKDGAVEGKILIIKFTLLTSTRKNERGWIYTYPETISNTVSSNWNYFIS